MRTYDSGDSSESFATSITVGDVDGDGNPDLVVANFCVNCSNAVVSVLMSNGDGTLQPAQVYSSGALGTNSITLGDVNEDGNLDIVIATGCENQVSCPTGGAGVLLGNGDGTFQAVKVYNSGALDAVSVVIADVNGDGTPDLVVANQNDLAPSAVVGVLLGNGDGTFQSPRTYVSGGKQATCVAVADGNGDGKLDLLVSNTASTGGKPLLVASGTLYFFDSER